MGYPLRKGWLWRDEDTVGEERGEVGGAQDWDQDKAQEGGALGRAGGMPAVHGEQNLQVRRGECR